MGHLSIHFCGRAFLSRVWGLYHSGPAHPHPKFVSGQMKCIFIIFYIINLLFIRSN
jgi:hypothetical protein